MPTIEQDNFADECVTMALQYGVNAHYVMAAAMLRSKLNNDVIGEKHGPYLWTQAEWDANPDRRNPALGDPLASEDISDWREQVTVFVLMTLGQFTALQAKLGQNPSALQLYQAQWPDAADPPLADNLQKACDDTRQAILDAINEQLPDPAQASSLAVTDPKKPVAQQSSNPPANLNPLQRNQWAAYHAALGAGLSDVAARALVANMTGESLRHPEDVHMDRHADGSPAGLAHGIVQWNPARSDAIQRHFGKLPNEMSVEDQTRAAIWEIQTFATYGKTKNALFQPGRTAEQIIDVIVANYEVPADIPGQQAIRKTFLPDVARVIATA
jgi:hypothetical protein